MMPPARDPAEVAERFRRLAAGLTERVGAVPDDRWSSPTPCEEWTTRQLVGHMVDVCAMHASFVGPPLPAGPTVDEDPAGAWQAAQSGVQALLDDREVASVEFEGFFGPTTLAQAADTFLCADVLLHTWDLARAAGLDERLDDDEVQRVQAGYASLGEAVRTPGVFGPAVEPPPGADAQARLLAYTGRRV